MPTVTELELVALRLKPSATDQMDVSSNPGAATVGFLSNSQALSCILSQFCFGQKKKGAFDKRVSQM